MKLNARQQLILDQIQAETELKIGDLKERHQVTEMTIRRDLEKLEMLGDVRRTFGGAVWIGKDVALQLRSEVLLEEKLQIGKKAASVIQPGESIFIDGGSTTLQLARSIKQIPDITVVTNAMNVAMELMQANVVVIIAGGMLRQSTSSVVGPITTETISKMVFDRVFLGATGFTIEHGYSNTNLYEAEVKKLAIKQAKQSYLLLDHTKFGIKTLFSFAINGENSHLITDRILEPAMADSIIAAGTEIMIAD